MPDWTRRDAHDPLAAALAVAGGRWTLSICSALIEGDLGFGQIRRAIPGITAIVLAKRLNRLIVDGIVEKRTPRAGGRRSVYGLSAWGHSLRASLDAIAGWGAARIEPGRPDARGENAMIEISALGSVPEVSRGYVRDLRVRWALEEAGIPYTTSVLGDGDKRSPSYLAWQPFGQVPALRRGEIEMFESAAIILWLAQHSDRLCPPDDRSRARMMSWVVAAVDTLGARVDAFTALDSFRAGEPWVELRRPQLRAAVEDRLTCLSVWLGDREFLEDGFTAGDLMVSFVLRELAGSGLLDAHPNLEAYRRRCEDRPAFARALAAQMADFTDKVLV